VGEARGGDPTVPDTSSRPLHKVRDQARHCRGLRSREPSFLHSYFLLAFSRAPSVLPPPSFCYCFGRPAHAPHTPHPASQYRPVAPRPSPRGPARLPSPPPLADNGSTCKQTVISSTPGKSIARLAASHPRNLATSQPHSLFKRPPIYI
jgi:hypothetical protein